MSKEILRKGCPAICFSLLLTFSFLSIDVETVKAYFLLVCIWIVAVLFVSKICSGISRSKRHNQNQLLFMITFFGGAGFYVKAFKVMAFGVLYNEDILMKFTYGLAAYVLVFVILSSTVMYLGCLMYKKQKMIK